MKYKRAESPIRTSLTGYLVAMTAIFSCATVFVNATLGGNGLTLSIAIGIFILTAIHNGYIVEYNSKYEFKEDYLVEHLGWIFKKKIPYSKMKVQFNDHTEFIYYTTNGKEPSYERSQHLFPVEYDKFKKELKEKLKVKSKSETKGK